MTSLPPRGPQGHITLEVLEERMYQQHEAIMGAVDGVNSRLTILNGSVAAQAKLIETNRLMMTQHIQEPGHATEIQRQLNQELLLKDHTERFAEIDKAEAIKEAITQDRKGTLDDQEIRHRRQLGMLALVSGIMTALINFNQVVRLINGVLN